MRIDEDGCFSGAMTRFLEQRCVIGALYSIADEQLFALFKAYWLQAPERFDHPALLGQFRVELVQHGFHAQPGGKWPHWLSLTAREQDNQRHQEERDRQPNIREPAEKPCCDSSCLNVTIELRPRALRHDSVECSRLAKWTGAGAYKS